jgi:hypothetical protein
MLYVVDLVILDPDGVSDRRHTRRHVVRFNLLKTKAPQWLWSNSSLITCRTLAQRPLATKFPRQHKKCVAVATSTGGAWWMMTMAMRSTESIEHESRPI